ncbi:MAG: CapA family protein [Oscillospiraceae bacterium]|nr:CapA family protein [Oscillospiraceae bacterium]
MGRIFRKYRKPDSEYEEEFEAYNEDAEQEEEACTPQLSLKERMKILSRKDRMGRAIPTWYRLLGVIGILLILLLVINSLLQKAWSSGNPQGEAVGKQEIQLSFAGDVCLGRDVAVYGEKRSYGSLFHDASRLWQDSELVFANLECDVIRQNTVYYDHEKPVKFAASQTALKVAAEKGVNVVSIANDHAADFGRKGVQHMIEALDRYEIEYAGAGANIDDAGKYKLIEADGVTVGFLAFTDVIPGHFTATQDGYGVLSSSYPQLYQNVLEASRYSDFVVVYVHWGEESGIHVTEDQKTLAHQLIDSGADVVIGTNPHTLQEIELYGNGIVFYSLGSFIADDAFRSMRSTALLQLNVNKSTGEGRFTLIPMRINNFHPVVTERAYYTSQIEKSLMSELREDFYTVDDRGRIQFTMPLYTPGTRQEKPEELEDMTATAEQAAEEEAEE